MAGAPEILHGTAIACGADAALIRGPSGSGKSDLALRCITYCPTTLIPLPAVLVADDGVHARIDGASISLSAPAPIKGLLEVRGLGLVSVPHVEPARLTLVVDLVGPGQYERLPDPATVSIMGFDLPVIALAPFEISAPVKLLLALQRIALPRN